MIIDSWIALLAKGLRPMASTLLAIERENVKKLKVKLSNITSPAAM